MASAAHAYQGTSFERVYEAPRPNVRVRTNPQKQEEASKKTLLTAVMFIIVLAVVAAIFAAIHVVLDSESVSLSVQAQTVSDNLIDARHEGSLLEVEVSTLSNPTRIQEEAQELGMISPDTATVILLGEDVVVTNDQGDLSLAGSLKVVARNE